MNTENNAANTKTTVFNLIILDESGSMDSLTNATISGCNETLSVIRAAQQQVGDRQRHLVSIYAFQSGAVPSRYIIKNAPIANVLRKLCPRYVSGSGMCQKVWPWLPMRSISPFSLSANASASSFTGT